MVDIIEAYHRTLVSKQFHWRDVAHIIVDALLMDFSFLSCVESLMARGGLFQDWSTDQLLIPYFGLETGPNQENFGVNSSRLNGYGVSLMHATFINRPIITSARARELFKEEVKKVIISLYDKGSIEIAPNILVEMGLVKCVENYTLAVPLFKGRDKVVLTDITLNVAHEAAETFIREYDTVKSAFRDIRYNEWLKYIGDFAEITFHFNMALVIKKLMESGCLPKIPDNPPLKWGIWMWESPWTQSFATIYRHMVEEVENIIERHGGIEEATNLLKGAEVSFKEKRFREAVKKLQKLINRYQMAQATK